MVASVFPCSSYQSLNSKSYLLARLLQEPPNSLTCRQVFLNHWFSKMGAQWNHRGSYQNPNTWVPPSTESDFTACSLGTGVF